jgi:hypothetical protein
VAGISNPAQVTQFVVRLKQAVAADDRAAIAGMVNYPLRVNSAAGRPTFYRNAAALSVNYARVFTPDIKEAVAVLGRSGEHVARDAKRRPVTLASSSLRRRARARTAERRLTAMR